MVPKFNTFHIRSCSGQVLGQWCFSLLEIAANPELLHCCTTAPISLFILSPSSCLFSASKYTQAGSRGLSFFQLFAYAARDSYVHIMLYSAICFTHPNHSSSCCIPANHLLGWCMASQCSPSISSSMDQLEHCMGFSFNCSLVGLFAPRVK